MKNFISLLLVCLFLMNVNANFFKNYPDALKCGVQGIDGQGAILFMHGANESDAMYCQVYASEQRCVIITGDTVTKVWGHEGTVNGCKGKTLKVLKKQGRTFGFARDMNEGEPPKKLRSEEQKSTTKPNQQKKPKQPKQKKTNN